MKGSIIANKSIAANLPAFERKCAGRASIASEHRNHDTRYMT
jgi:hypothetical protein